MVTDGVTVDILMSTYNGSAYLTEQLESLLAQTYSHWRLLVKDDGSSDETVAILESFQDAHVDRVQILSLDPGQGACGSFSQLLEHASAPYVMFCDQDDVWKPEKIALSLEAMRGAELKHGADTPLLIYSDLELVDQELKPLAASFWQFQHIDPERVQLSQLLLENVVTGCTTMLNAPLRSAVLPVSESAVMHDWWIAMVASVSGRLICIPQATILYRQHGRNDVGASRYSLASLIKRHIFGDGLARYARLNQSRNAQNLAFYARFAQSLSEDESRVMQTVLALNDVSLVRRAHALVRLRCYPNGLMRKLFFVAFVLLMSGHDDNSMK